MNGLNIYFFNLGILSLISLVFILIGRQFQQSKILTFRVAFFSVFSGVLILSAAFAILKTGGKTIMLGFLLLAIFYFVERRSNPISSIKVPLPQHKSLFILLGIFFCTLVVFTWSFLTIAQFDGFPYYISSGTEINQNDYLINIFRSYYLGITGEENYYHVFNNIDTAYHGPKPYHYLELWTAAALTYFFGDLTAEKFILITIPLYNLIAFLGILALWEKYQQIRWYHLLLSIAFLFFAGLHFQFYDQWKIPNLSLPILTHRVKMCTYYPFILAFLLQIDKKKPQQSILFLVGLMVATVVVAPALSGGIGLFLIYQFLILGNKRNAISATGYFVGILLFIFLFYKFTETGQFNIRANAGASSLSSNIISGLITAPLDQLIFLCALLFKEIILYSPLLLVGFFLFSKEKRIFTYNFHLLVLIIGTIVSGAVFYTILKEQKDAIQLFYNIANAILNCLLIWVIIKLLSKPLKGNLLSSITWNHIVIGIFLSVMLVKQFSYAVKKNIYEAIYKETYNDEYLEQIKTYVLMDEKINMGAAIKGGEDYNSRFSKQTAAYTLGYYLAYMENGSIALNISDFDIPEMELGDEQDRVSNLFYRFVKEQKARKEFISIGQSQLEFIKKHDLDFIIISKNGLLRPELKSIIADSIIDNVSGERFLLIEK